MAHDDDNDDDEEEYFPQTKTHFLLQRHKINHHNPLPRGSSLSIYRIIKHSVRTLTQFDDYCFPEFLIRIPYFTWAPFRAISCSTQWLVVRTDWLWLSTGWRITGSQLNERVELMMMIANPSLPVQFTDSVSSPRRLFRTSARTTIKSGR